MNWSRPAVTSGDVSIPTSVDTTRHYRDLGFRSLTAGTDVALLKAAATQLVKDLRSA